MTKIKLCGLTRLCDIEAANVCRPDYIGFVFAKKSRRFVSPELAKQLGEALRPEIRKVGVFVNEEETVVAELLNAGIIDAAQLHGSEDRTYVERLRRLTEKPLIQAFAVRDERDIERANESRADLVLLDNGAGGTGSVFNWDWVRGINRPYILAGGLDAENVAFAVRSLSPYGVDVSSGIETNGVKDKEKMYKFVRQVRAGESEE